MQRLWHQRTFWQGLVVGLVVGLFIAWVIWPVRYVNAYPRDLREEDKLTYLLLVARDYQRTGDANALAARLRSFDKSELPVLLQKAEDRFANDAESVEALATVRQLVTMESGVGAAETGTAGPAESGGIGRLLSYLFIGLGLAVLLVLAARIVVQLQSLRVVPQEGVPPADAPSPVASYPEPVAQRAPVGVTTAEEEAVEEEDEEEEEEAVAWGTVPRTVAEEDVAAEERTQEETEAVEAVPAKPSPRPPQPAPPAPTLRQVDTFQSVFIAQAHGDEPFDDVFTIYDEKDRTLGECGIAEAETRHQQPGKPIAMEVWLFDKQDTTTHQAFILSPWAARQADIRAKFEEKGPVVVAKAGAQVRLSARSLFLEGEIKDVAFAQSGEGDEVFTKLALTLNVYQRLESA